MPPTPFPTFESPREHNGIRLAKTPAKRMLAEFMKTREDCAQQSFQRAHDERASGDHAREHSKLIKDPIRDGKKIAESCATASFLGNAAIINLTLARSNS